MDEGGDRGQEGQAAGGMELTGPFSSRLPLPGSKLNCGKPTADENEAQKMNQNPFTKLVLVPVENRAPHGNFFCSFQALFWGPKVLGSLVRHGVNQRQREVRHMLLGGG